MPDLVLPRVFEEGLQFREHVVTVQLLGRAGIVVGDGHVAGLAGLRRKRQADDLGIHVVEAVGLRVEGRELRLLELANPAVECVVGEHGFVFDGRLFNSFVTFAFVVQLAQQGAQLEVLEQFTQRCRVSVSRFEFVDADVEVDVPPDRRKVLRQFQLLDAVAKAFTDLALDLFAVLDDTVGTVVKVQPFCRGLGADPGHTRYVVGAVADERQVVDDLLREYVELRLDRITVHGCVVHRVDQGDSVADELRQVLVTGRDEHVEPLSRRFGAQRAYDVVCFDAGNLQQRQAHRRDGVEDRLHLRPEIIRHRRAIRLVLREQLVAEGLARCVEDHGNALRLVFAHQLEDHGQHAMHRTGGLTLGVTQRRQSVKSAIQVRRAVDQDEVRHRRRFRLAPAGLVFLFAVLFVRGIVGR